MFSSSWNIKLHYVFMVLHRPCRMPFKLLFLTVALSLIFLDKKAFLNDLGYPWYYFFLEYFNEEKKTHEIWNHVTQKWGCARPASYLPSDTFPLIKWHYYNPLYIMALRVKWYSEGNMFSFTYHVADYFDIVCISNISSIYRF